MEQNNPSCAVWGYYTVLGPGGMSSVGSKKEDLFEVYPNPAKEFIKINLSEGAKANYEIIDMSGKV